MICITVTPESRTLAKVDLLNASRQGDIVELCLDHLAKEPDVKDLISAIDKPVIVSCRRPQDGGQWKGTEEQRLMLLRQAIVASPAYVELDLDIAPRIPRFGTVQRLISFTRMDRPEHDIDAVFDEAAQHQADVVKFTWPTPTLDAAWPLLAAVSQKRRLPIVGMGLGRPEITFSLLGRKYGSPWIYAALEQGMEAHPGQATVSELVDDYHCREIDRKTSFVAIAGFGEGQTFATRVLNHAFQAAEMNIRCLPIQPGELKSLRKMLDALKIKAVIATPGLSAGMTPLADQIDSRDRDGGGVDLLLKKDDGWHGFSTLWRSAIGALESHLGTANGDRPLERRTVLVLGAGGLAAALTHGLAKRKGQVSICARDDAAARTIAQQQGCRFVPSQALYDTLADVVVLADPSLVAGQKQGMINPSLFRPAQVVVDVTDPPRESSLFVEARDRGCGMVSPQCVFESQLTSQFRAMTGKDLSQESLAAGRAAGA